MTVPQYNFTVTQLDLDFILKQIKIAEASTNPLTGAAENLPALVGSPLLPYGLRTVDGTWNSLLPGKERMGAADNVMPRLVPADLQIAEARPAGLFAPTAGTVVTSYAQVKGNVYDTQPRVASNLISDQTANNPAAVAAALQLSGHANPVGEAAVIAGLNFAVQYANFLIKSAAAAIIAAGTDSSLLSSSQQQYIDATSAHTTAFAALKTELNHAGLVVSDNGTIEILNLSPDIGLSPSFNSWMTIFGQFFDHGLDLVTKGGNGTVYVPLLPDDPLYVTGSPTNFMVLTRAKQVNGPGADGILGTADDTTHESINTTTPFIDQNQTYTSHPSHQVFLREYHLVDGKPMSTGRLLDGAHGAGNWGEVKAQALTMLGIRLVDMDVHNVPLLATDRYGEFLRGPNGFAQIVVRHAGADGILGNADDGQALVEGSLSAPISTSGTLQIANGTGGFMSVSYGAALTDHAFLNDIAHGAAPGFYDHDHNPGTPAIALVADADNVVGSLPNPNYNPALPVGPNNSPVMAQPVGTYDNELLDRHFITGDGRGNENIALTTVHTIFHSEHNRLVEDYKHTILQSGDRAFINQWLSVALPTTAVLPTTEAGISALIQALNTSNAWDGERLFQAGRFVTEMQYQHMVFEEFARAVQPAINPFVFSNSPDIDPSIVAEFAHVVYRFGHSMLNESVDRIGFDMKADPQGLIAAFLNPLAFDVLGGVQVSVEAATGAVIRGLSRQTGNEIDEFVTEALRNNLVGLPLDLPTLNMARARETGMPSFNEARAAFFASSGDTQLAPFTSWSDMAPHLKNPVSIINFIAAYGKYSTITSATTLADKRAAAVSLVLGDATLTGQAKIDFDAARVAFLNSTGTWTAANSGLNDIDLWIGGLAERKNEFGGMLGATFNFVFEKQMEDLQNGDRFYYLSRTQGTNIINELEGNTFAKLIMRNSDLGNAGSSHLSGLVFQTTDYILEVNQNQQIGADPLETNPILQFLHPKVIRHAAGADVNGDGQADGAWLEFNGGEHVVLGGTAGNDTLIGSLGIDTLWGDGGNDRLDGGNEADHVHGGDGDDIITDSGTPVGGADFLYGDEGNDVISSGMGNDVVFGGGGTDFIFTGNDATQVFAGRGDDFVLGGNGADDLRGNEGDDWIEGGEGFDAISGENSELFFNSPIVGHDVLNGQGNDTDYDGESGDDIMVQGPGIQRNNGMFGFDWGTHKGDPTGANSDLGIGFFPAQAQFTLRDRFDSVEGLSGWNHNDVLIGATLLKAFGAGNPVDESDLKSQNVSLINGFAELLGLTPAQVAALPFNTSVINTAQGAEVIIGGGGSDTIQGNLGNDYLDGDAWLNVRIRVVHNVNEANTAANEWFTVDTMNVLKARLLSGEINPGQLHIVREILQSTTAATDLDTAVYNGNKAEYTVTRNANGTITVAHTNPANLLAANDGVDTIRNFEFLKFADQTVFLGNVAPVITSDGGGAAAVKVVPENSTAVTTVTATDANNVAFDPFNPQTMMYLINGGADAALFAIDATTGVLRFVAAPNFELPTDNGTNNVYDVIVQVSDGLLVDTQALAITVVNANDLATGEFHIASYTTTLLNTSAVLTAFSTIADPDVPALVASYQWQRLVGTVWTSIAGATSATLSAQSNTTARVILTYTDPFGTNAITSVETAFVGTSLNNTLTGTNENDLILGLGGNDTLTGSGGNDTVDGGAGNDTLRAGLNDGDDVYIGGAGTDVYDLSLTSAAATVNLTTGVASSAQTGTDTLASIENVIGSSGNDVITDGAGANDLAGGDGNDTFVMTVDNARDTVNGGVGVSDIVDYSAFTTNLTVTLGASVVVGGSGLTVLTSDLITNVENFRGGAANDAINGNVSTNVLFGGDGNDVLNGLGGADTLNGGAGNDTLNGGVGADILTGGAGADTFNYTNITETVVGAANRDVITDFLSGTDKLDFLAIDANTLTAGNGTFTFNPVAGAAFTGPGQLRYRYEGTGANEVTVIEGNVNANLAADFEVALLGRHLLLAADLIL